MPPLLPEIRDQAELDRRRGDEQLWLPAVAAIAGRHGLPGEVRLFPTGSAVVCAVGDRHVVKLHEPWNRALCENEIACLRLIRGRLPVASPELVATGELEGWGYLIMTRLPGQPLSAVRDRLAAADLVAIAGQTATLARALHAVPVARDAGAFRPWAEFVAEQRAGCALHHRANGLPKRLLATLDDQLAGIALDIDEPVFLHTELTDTNLMVAREKGRWALSGVFDFEPSMLGHPLYDLPAVTIFVARGEPNACRAGLTAFGLRELDHVLRGQLLACTLLHRYSHLGFFLRQAGVPDYPASWSDLARALFGF